MYSRTLPPNVGTRWVLVVNATPLPLYRRERSGYHCIGGWVGVKNHAPTGIQCPHRPAHRESLHQLCYLSSNHFQAAKNFRLVISAIN